MTPVALVSPSRSTLAAGPAPVGLDVGVGLGELMPPLAVGLTSEPGRGVVPVPSVTATGGCLQVVGPDAQFDFAQVVDNQPLGDWSVGQLVAEPVGVDLLAASVAGFRTEDAVFAVGASRPQPTRVGLVDASPESNLRRRFSHAPILSHSWNNKRRSRARRGRK